MAILRAIKWPKLIWRKIWGAEKSWHFPIWLPRSILHLFLGTNMKNTLNNKSLSRLMCKVEWFTGNISLVKAYSHGSDKAEQSYSPFFGTNITVRIRHLCHFLTQPQMNHIEEMHVLNKKHQKQIEISKEIYGQHTVWDDVLGM